MRRLLKAVVIVMDAVIEEVSVVVPEAPSVDEWELVLPPQPKATFRPMKGSDATMGIRNLAHEYWIM